jgi:hypothetical protein
MFRPLPAILAVVASCASICAAQQAATLPAEEADTLLNLKVVSDNVPDVTSVEALLADIIKPDMTDEQKATAVWETVYHSRFWNPSSRGNLRYELGGSDPIIIMNCFSPTICQQDAENCIALWGMLGYSARMWQLGWHTTPELYYGGKWRHFDATMGRVSRDADGEVCSVTEPQPSTGRGGGRRGWIRPESYISSTEGISLGQRMDLTIRPGETFTRYWHPLSKDPDYWCASSDGQRPDNRLRRDRRRLADAMKLTTRRFEPMPDDAAYGNGRWIYQPDFAARNWQRFVEDSHNVAVTKADDMYAISSVVIHPAEAGKEAWVTFRVRSPYVISGGWVSGYFAMSSGADSIELLVSTDGGRNWRTMWTKGDARANSETVGLRPYVARRFDYLVKVRMLAAGDVEKVRVGGLRFETISMNNPFMLPALKLGKTNVTVDAGPQLDTLSIHPSIATSEYEDYVHEQENVTTSWKRGAPEWNWGWLAAETGKESYVVFKVSTPGDLKKIRWGGRFVDDNENNKLFYSFDGNNWTAQPWTYTQRVKDTANEKRAQVALYEVLDKFPKGTKEVYLKYWFFRPADADEDARLLLSGMRIDADYAPAARASRPPVEVTYCWTQDVDGQAVEKTHTKVIDTYPTRYGIIVRGDNEPMMKWISVRLKTEGTPTTQP